MNATCWGILNGGIYCIEVLQQITSCTELNDMTDIKRKYMLGYNLSGHAKKD
jgi:hypothetical protein